MGFTTLGDSSSTATAEIAVNGMDPQELGFSPAESTTGSSGQSLPHMHAAAKEMPLPSALEIGFFKERKPFKICFIIKSLSLACLQQNFFQSLNTSSV